MKHLGRIFLIAISVVLALGCSGPGDGDNPIIPADNLSAQTPAQPIAASNRFILGIWDCYLNLETREIEAVPVRTADYRVDINKFLNPPGNQGIISFAIYETPLEDEYIGVNLHVSLMHPFPDYPEFTGFDTRGIFIAGGPEVSAQDESLTFSSDCTKSPVMMNPDGYTRWWNYPEFSGGDRPLFSYCRGVYGSYGEFSATVNPYKYFADTLEPRENLVDFFGEAENVGNRGAFTAEDWARRNYELRFPCIDGHYVISFQYVVDTSWAPGDPANSGSSTEWDIPGDFPSEANMYEPIAIDFNAEWHSIFETSIPVVADVEVFSWQAVETPDKMFDIGRMTVSSAVDDKGYPVNVEFSGSELDAMRVPGSGTANSSVWEIEIESTGPYEPGRYYLLVGVEPLPDAPYDQGFGQPCPDTPVMAYTVGIIDFDASIPSMGQFDFVLTAWPQSIQIDEPVYFDFSDNDVYYPPEYIEIDWDGDGSEDSTQIFLHDNLTFTHSWDLTGTYSMMAWGIYNHWPWNVPMDKPIPISVTEDCVDPPTAAVEPLDTDHVHVGYPKTFCVMDTEGTGPLTFEWNWDDGHGYEEVTTTPFVEHTFDEVRDFNVMCRATNDCGVDELDEPLVITVYD